MASMGRQIRANRTRSKPTAFVTHRVEHVRHHPRGLAPRIVNLAEWAAHFLHRMTREAELTPAPALAALLDEASSYELPALSRP
jgi:hypothetical protein